MLMESHGVEISTREISNLSGEFLLRFYCIHRRHMNDLGMKDYILHLNDTGESGCGTAFMAKDGITGITMDSTVMPSESSDYITHFPKNIKDQFGHPDTVLRDMSPAIMESISAIYPVILQIICHYHFIKDLGKSVFGTYEELRTAMVSTKSLATISKIIVLDRGIEMFMCFIMWNLSNTIFDSASVTFDLVDAMNGPPHIHRDCLNVT